MTSADVEACIEAFVRSHFSVSPSDPGFDRSVDLFEGGYVDSVGTVELLEFIREEFQVEVSESELLSDDFSRIDGIALIVRRLVESDSSGGDSRVARQSEG